MSPTLPSSISRTCEPVLTEAAHFLGDPEPSLAAVADGLLVCPWELCEQHARVRELVRKYADQPMDLADACVVAMSEKWWDGKVGRSTSATSRSTGDAAGIPSRS